MWKNNTLQEGRDRIWDDIESQIREANDVEIVNPLHEDWENNDTDLEFDDEAAADSAPSMSLPFILHSLGYLYSELIFTEQEQKQEQVLQHHNL